MSKITRMIVKAGRFLVDPAPVPREYRYPDKNGFSSDAYNLRKDNRKVMSALDANARKQLAAHGK